MIDIIIVTYNAKNKLRQCLGSIEKYTGDMPYKITIFDNASTDGTRFYLKTYAKQFPGKHINILYGKKNLGFSGGANIALKNTKNKFIALVDDDAKVTRDWLSGLYSKIRGRRSVGIVGPKLLTPAKYIIGAGMFIWDHVIFHIGAEEKDTGQRNYIRDVDCLAGPCWLVRRDVFKKVGLYDERFFPSQYEDIDYCIRTRLAGYRIIYDGTSAVIHHNLLRGNFKANRKKFFKKWPDLSIFPMVKSDGISSRKRAYNLKTLPKKGIL